MAGRERGGANRAESEGCRRWSFAITGGCFSGLRGSRPLNVFVGYEFSPSSDTAIRWVTSLKKFGPRKITITHLSWSPQDILRLGMGDGARLGEMSPEAQWLLEQQMREKCGALLNGEDANLHVTAGCGRPDLQLIDLAKTEGADR